MGKYRRQGRRNSRRGFERAGTLILGRSRVGGLPEVRVPPLLARNLLLLLAAIGAVALWLWLDARFYVLDPSVEGTARVSADEVLQASGLPGLHILWVRPAKIELKIVEQLPALERAQVACKLPARCTVTVVERQPRMTWEDEGGQLWWIDDEGVLFPAEESLSEGWMVRGPLPQGEDGRIDERVRVGLAELWAAGVDIPSQRIYYAPDRGLVFTDERGWRVIVGQGAGVEGRLQLLERLAVDLEARSLRPRFVDVRFVDAPYYSLTNDW